MANSFPIPNYGNLIGSNLTGYQSSPTNGNSFSSTSSSSNGSTVVSSGVSATIAITGTVVGLPSTAPSVANLGTSSAALFQFTLPLAATGPTGSSGLMGLSITGPAGPIGLMGIPGIVGPTGPLGPPGQGVSMSGTAYSVVSLFAGTGTFTNSISTTAYATNIQGFSMSPAPWTPSTLTLQGATGSSAVVFSGQSATGISSLYANSLNANSATLNNILLTGTGANLSLGNSQLSSTGLTTSYQTPITLYAASSTGASVSISADANANLVISAPLKAMQGVQASTGSYTGQLAVSSITGGSAYFNNSVSAASFTGGSAGVSGLLTFGSATGGSLYATSLTTPGVSAANSFTGTSATLSGVLTFGSATTTGQVSAGSFTGTSGTFSSGVSAPSFSGTNLYLSNLLQAAGVNSSGNVSGTNGLFSGGVSGTSLTTSGTVSGSSFTGANITVSGTASINKITQTGTGITNTFQSTVQAPTINATTALNCTAGTTTLNTVGAQSVQTTLLTGGTGTFNQLYSLKADGITTRNTFDDGSGNVNIMGALTGTLIGSTSTTITTPALSNTAPLLVFAPNLSLNQPVSMFIGTSAQTGAYIGFQNIAPGSTGNYLFMQAGSNKLKVGANNSVSTNNITVDDGAGNLNFLTANPSISASSLTINAPLSLSLTGAGSSFSDFNVIKPGLGSGQYATVNVGQSYGAVNGAGQLSYLYNSNGTGSNFKMGLVSGPNAIAINGQGQIGTNNNTLDGGTGQMTTSGLLTANGGISTSTLSTTGSVVVPYLIANNTPTNPAYTALVAGVKSSVPTLTAVSNGATLTTLQLSGTSVKANNNVLDDGSGNFTAGSTIQSNGNTFLRTNTANSGNGARLMGAFSSPYSGRMVFGDGTGWKYTFASINSTGTAYNDQFTITDQGAISTVRNTFDDGLGNLSINSTNNNGTSSTPLPVLYSALPVNGSTYVQVGKALGQYGAAALGFNYNSSTTGANNTASLSVNGGPALFVNGAGRVFTNNSTLDDGGGNMYVGGTDLKLGVNNTTGRGAGGYLAVQDANNTLKINYVNSFSGGTVIGGPKVSTTSNTLDDGSGNMTISGNATPLAVSYTGSSNNYALATFLAPLVPVSGGVGLQVGRVAGNSANFNSALLSFTSTAANSTANLAQLSSYGGPGLTVNGAGQVKTPNNTLDDGSGNMTITSSSGSSPLQIYSPGNTAFTTMFIGTTGGTNNCGYVQFYGGAGTGAAATGNYTRLGVNGNGALTIYGSSKIQTQGGNTLDDGSGNMTVGATGTFGSGLFVNAIGGGTGVYVAQTLLATGALATGYSSTRMNMTRSGYGGFIDGGIVQGVGHRLSLGTYDGSTTGSFFLTQGGQVNTRSSTLDDGVGNMTVGSNLTLNSQFALQQLQLTASDPDNTASAANLANLTDANPNSSYAPTTNAFNGTANRINIAVNSQAYITKLTIAYPGGLNNTPASINVYNGTATVGSLLGTMICGSTTAGVQYGYFTLTTPVQAGTIGLLLPAKTVSSTTYPTFINEVYITTAGSLNVSAPSAFNSQLYVGGQLTSNSNLLVAGGSQLAIGGNDSNAGLFIQRYGGPGPPINQAMTMNTNSISGIGSCPLVYQYGYNGSNSVFQSAFIVTDNYAATGCYLGQSQNFARIYSDGAMGVNGPLCLGTTTSGQNQGVSGATPPIMTKVYGSATATRSITLPDLTGVVALTSQLPLNSFAAISFSVNSSGSNSTSILTGTSDITCSGYSVFFASSGTYILTGSLICSAVPANATWTCQTSGPGGVSTLPIYHYTLNQSSSVVAMSSDLHFVITSTVATSYVNIVNNQNNISGSLYIRRIV